MGDDIMKSRNCLAPLIFICFTLVLFFAGCGKTARSDAVSSSNENDAIKKYIHETPALVLFAAGKAEGGNNKVLKELIDSKEEDINIRDKYGNTALIAASRNGIAENVVVLLKAKADVSLKNNKGETALSLAVRSGYKDIVQLLKKAGAK
jgi:ankyrin repeat protein